MHFGLFAIILLSQKGKMLSFRYLSFRLRVVFVSSSKRSKQARREAVNMNEEQTFIPKRKKIKENKKRKEACRPRDQVFATTNQQPMTSSKEKKLRIIWFIRIPLKKMTL